MPPTTGWPAESDANPAGGNPGLAASGAERLAGERGEGLVMPVGMAVVAHWSRRHHWSRIAVLRNRHDVTPYRLYAARCDIVPVNPAGLAGPARGPMADSGRITGANILDTPT